MCNNKECAAYLKGKAGFQRCMGEFRKKWEQYGRVSGKILLKNSTEEERAAIGGIVGKKYEEGTVEISFSKFEQSLQKTRFAPVDMKSVLEEYFGITIYTRQEQRERALQGKERFFCELLECAEQRENHSKMAVCWIRELQAAKKYGYQILIREYEKEEEAARQMAEYVLKALLYLEKTEGEEHLLAVFSAEISGNPHYFDRGTAASQLLTHAVCFWKEREIPATAYEWRDCMQEAGLIPDNIASMVHAFGVLLETKEGLHPAYQAFFLRKEPFVLTAENLKWITGARTTQKKVYVVENEMVFLHLTETAREAMTALVCTSGQLRSAAFQLLDHFADSGTEIYYSGDLDPEGMDIADRLWQRYKDALHLWRMDREDYSSSISGEWIGERRLAKLERLQNPGLRRTAEIVRERKLAGYQENLLNELAGDIKGTWAAVPDGYENCKFEKEWVL